MSTFYKDFSDMLSQSVTIYRRTGVDSYNKPVYDAGTPYECRVTFGTKVVRNRTGEIVPASGTVWLFSRIQISVDDKIIFLSDSEPSPAETTQLFPLRVDSIADEKGHYYNKVYFE